MKCKHESITCNGKVKAYDFGPYNVEVCDWHKISVYMENTLKLKNPQPFYYKKDQQLWYVYVDSDTGKCELWEYIVRTIRRPWVYAINKIPGLTWVKKSSKHGDFGWAYPIEPMCRQRCMYGKKFIDLFTTKRQAWMSIKKEFSNKDAIEDYGKKVCKKVLSTANRMITKIKKENLKCIQKKEL